MFFWLSMKKMLVLCPSKTSLLKVCMYSKDKVRLLEKAGISFRSMNGKGMYESKAKDKV